MWKRCYNPGLRWNGVGMNITGNTVSNGPHQGMWGS